MVVATQAHLFLVHTDHDVTLLLADLAELVAVYLGFLPGFKGRLGGH